MSLALLKPNESADLFVDLCSRLRAMGATRVEAFGFSASFALPEKHVPVPEHREPPREPEEPLTTPEARDLQARAKLIAAGGRP